jgi:probable HAF family extracellular repeat protein
MALAVAVAATATALTCVRPALAQTSYAIIDLGANTYPEGVSDSGAVAGYVTYSARNTSYNRAFVRVNGVKTEIGTLGGKASEARAVNNGGQAVGHSLNAAGARRAFLWDATSGMRDLNTIQGPDGVSAASLGWTLTAAYNINNNGQIVGHGTHPSQEQGGNNTFLWQRDAVGNVSVTAVSLRNAQYETRGISDDGLVAGDVEHVATNSNGETHSANQASIWKNGTNTHLGFLSENSATVLVSHAYGCNLSSQVVGFSSTASGSFRAFLWSPESGGGMINLGTLGAPERLSLQSNAYSINNSGQVVGWAERNTSYDNDPQYQRAYIWDAAGGMKDLNSLSNVGTTWYLKQARDISNNGHIVGNGFLKVKKGTQANGFLLTPR